MIAEFQTALQVGQNSPLTFSEVREEKKGKNPALLAMLTT